MDFTLHCSKAGKKIKLETVEPGVVRIYSCGPTVHNYAHIGNFRSFVFTDILRRSLKFLGYKVIHAMNITDVDDKTIASSQKAGISLRDYTSKYSEEFFTDLKKLGVETVEHSPRATDHIEDMIQLISKLDEHGLVYQKEGCTYFAIDKFAEYGELSHVDKERIMSGARYDSDEYTKDDVRDFVLWKAPKDEKEDRWPSKFGEGRPGWHLECSAMIRSVFNGPIDIHTGGVDLLFPHHENELAQSRGAYPEEEFVRYWMHNEHLLVENKKMAKSDGNFFTLRDLEHMGHDPRLVRYVLAGSHYRSKLNFKMDGLAAAKNTLERLDAFTRRILFALNLKPFNDINEWGGAAIREHAKFFSELYAYKQNDYVAKTSIFINPRILDLYKDFSQALADDLNTPQALAALFELVAYGNEVLETSEVDTFVSYQVLFLLLEFDRVLNVFDFSPHETEDTVAQLSDDEVESLIMERRKARASKNFARSDEIRDQLANAGIVVEDTKTGIRWTRS